MLPILLKINLFLFFCLLFFLMCVKDRCWKPRVLCLHLWEKEYIASVFVYGMMLLFFLFIGAFYRHPLRCVYFVLPFLVIGIYMTYPFCMLHYIFVATFFLLVCYTIYTKRSFRFLCFWGLFPLLLLPFSLVWAEFLLLFIVILFL